MNIESEKPKMVYKYTTNKGIEMYSLGLSKKDKEGNYTNGFINCKFRKDIKLENKTKIQIKSAWLDFYVKDRITYPFIFINEFEIIQDDKQENKQTEEVNEFSAMKTTTEYKEDEVTLTDADIDKVFDNQMDLPF